MKLTFFADREACFLKGIDTTDRYIKLDVDPSKLTERQRGLLMDRITNVDHVSSLRPVYLKEPFGHVLRGGYRRLIRDWSDVPFMATSGAGFGYCCRGVQGITLEALLESIETDEKELKKMGELLIRSGKLMTEEKFSKLVDEHMEKGNR